MGIIYEVRTQAWNCTCPAFAFAAFAGEGMREFGQDSEEKSEGLGCRGTQDRNGDGERWGGLAIGSHVPVCKHLLACVLVERCRGLDEYMETRMVKGAEMAGWAAGWGG